jgi:hypothetical protein
VKYLLSTAALIACFSGTAAFANEQEMAARDACDTKKPKDAKECCDPEKMKSKGGCDMLNRPVVVSESKDNHGVVLGLRGDVLYMNYTTPVLTYASEQYTMPGNILRSKILNVPGKASVGCALAASYTIPHSPGYTFQAGWYHIVTEYSSKNKSGVLVPAHVVALDRSAPATSSITADIAINLFDLILQDTFTWGKSFTFAPAAGVIGGYMDSSNRAKFTASSGSFYTGGTITVATLNQTVKYEGIGAKVGFDYAYKIMGGFKFFGNFFYNAMYGYTKAKLTSTINGSYLGLNGSNVSYHQHHGRSFLDTLIGLSWGGAFNCDSYFMDVHVGWRYQAFMDGWLQMEDITDNSIRPLNLTGQGLQAGVAFKF